VVTHPDEVVPDSRTAGAHLEALAGQLGRAGLCARITHPIGRPATLHVLNPDQPDLEERVVIDRCENGTWWFWWAWAERIAPAGQMADAAESIRRVVSARA
jgi:hypothetical protein